MVAAAHRSVVVNACKHLDYLCLVRCIFVYMLCIGSQRMRTKGAPPRYFIMFWASKDAPSRYFMVFWASKDAPPRYFIVFWASKDAPPRYFIVFWASKDAPPRYFIVFWASKGFRRPRTLRSGILYCLGRPRAQQRRSGQVFYGVLGVQGRSRGAPVRYFIVFWASKGAAEALRSGILLCLGHARALRSRIL